MAGAAAHVFFGLYADVFFLILQLFFCGPKGGSGIKDCRGKIRVERLVMVFKIQALSGFFDSAPFTFDKDTLQWRSAQNDSPLEISLLSEQYWG